MNLSKLVEAILVGLSLSCSAADSFSRQFLQDLLIVLLEHGLDPNVRFSQRNPHVLFALVEMASRNARTPPDLHPVCELTRTLLQYGADPNVCCHLPQPGDYQMPAASSLIFPPLPPTSASGSGSGTKTFARTTGTKTSTFTFFSPLLNLAQF